MKLDRALADLQHVAHRPWALPTRRWIMRQTWHELLFAHWPVSESALQAVLPAGLEIDTFAGDAWLGIVPFRMSGIRRRGWPALPGHAALPELNVRTYVRVGDKPGVYFFSLDAGNRLAVWAARRFFHLPYFFARMRSAWVGEWVDYASERMHRGAPRAVLRARYGPVADVREAERGAIAHWLTERYCLYTVDPRGALWRGEIHHRPWPLQRAEAEIAQNEMTAQIGLDLPDTPPLLHYAERLDVVVWPLERVAQR